MTRFMDGLADRFDQRMLFFALLAIFTIAGQAAQFAADRWVR